MAIILNDNIRVNAGKPVDTKYLNTGNTTYISTTEVNNTIAIPERHIGLTVNVNGVEYWYKDNVFDVNLEPKIGAVGLGTITGATNIGFFSGTSAVQTLDITTTSGLPVSNHLDYRGLYVSQHNYYYRDTNGVVRIGIPSDGIGKRAYIKTVGPIKSFIWNEAIGGGEELGWALVDGNVDLKIGESANSVNYYINGNAYNTTNWVQGNSYSITNNTITISNVIGNLSSGTTLTVGGPVYSRTICNDTTLELRTIRSLTPQTLSVNYDGAFVNICSSITCAITGGTNGIFTSTSGNVNVVRLGGNLNNHVRFNDDVGSVPFEYDFCMEEIRNFHINAQCIIFDNGDTQWPARYGGNMFLNPISSYSPFTIPDINTVSSMIQNSPLVKPVCNLTVDTYLAQSTDFYIGASGGTSITLPISPPTGTIIVVADICGNATTNNEVQINTSGSQFFGGSSESLIGTAFGSYTYIYNGGRNRWGVLAFNPALA